MSDLDAYRSLYVAESRENLENIVKNLLILEKKTDEGAISEIFRSAHSLKGMSASMGFEDMEQICHAMEDIFQSVRSKELEVDAAVIDLLLTAADDIEAMVDDIEAGGPGHSPEIENRLESLRSWTSTGSRGKEQGAPAGNSIMPDQVMVEDEEKERDLEGRILYQISLELNPACDTKNLRGMIILQNLDGMGEIVRVVPERDVVEDGVFDGRMQVSIRSEYGQDLLLKAAQISDVFRIDISSGDADLTSLPVQSRPGSPGPTIEDSGTRADKSREVKNIRVDITRLDHMMNLIEDLVINRGRVIQIAQKYRMKELDETLNMIGRSVADLQNLMMNIRMIPLSHIFNRFPRTVRDLSRKEGKEIELVITGGQTELDRSVMEGLNDPLLHLIRNAIDHGIEIPEQRRKTGKPEKGVIQIAARRDRDNVIIVIEDDGAGINPERVLGKAVQRGLISQETGAGMSREEIYDLLFQPGFSTAERITDVSGRGVGLDVVRTAMNAVKGSIKVDSMPGRGTRFELLLPPTMAIVDVMMVRINDRRCAIPVNNIIEVASLTGAGIHTIGSRETILLRDEVLPLDRLEDMFGASRKSEILVVIQNQEKKSAITVDAIEGQQEVVIKPLTRIIGVCRGIGGVTIPGDGQVVPVLDVNSIVTEN
jgi:two-component system, chemotaxis family, sensor kinase CheA